MRTPFLAANWKMNLTRREAKNLVEDLVKQCHPLQDREMVIAPPFHLLGEVAGWLQGKANFHLAAQNCHFKDAGAFTGEISAPMLKDIGCHSVIIGHSERRAMFGETDESCSKKVGAALAQGWFQSCASVRRSSKAKPEEPGKWWFLKLASASKATAFKAETNWSSPTNRSGLSAPAKPTPPKMPTRP